jgi:hypothetical protein
MAIFMMAVILVPPAAAAETTTTVQTASVTPTTTQTGSEKITETDITATTATPEPPITTHPDDRTNLQTAASVLISIAEKARQQLLVYANGTITGSFEAEYSMGVSYQNFASTAYEKGEYLQAIHYAIDAMRMYKHIFAKMHRETSKEEKEEHIKEMLERDEAWLHYVNKVISNAKEDGIDTTQLETLYTRAIQLRNKIEQDIENNNTEELQNDLAEYKQIRVEINKQIQDIMHQKIIKHKNQILKLYNKRIDKLIQYLKENGAPDEVIQELEQRKEKVNQLMEEGNIKEALHEISETTKSIRKYLAKEHNPQWGQNGRFNWGNTYTWAWGHSHTNNYITSIAPTWPWDKNRTTTEKSESEADNDTTVTTTAEENNGVAITITMTESHSEENNNVTNSGSIEITMSGSMSLPITEP